MPGRIGVRRGGGRCEWLRDGLGLIGSSAEVETLATAEADSGGVYFVPAFVGLGAPYWDPQARGLIVGLTRGTDRAHIARAAIESIAFQTRDVLDAMQRDSHITLDHLKVDGGASRNDLLMQFQADLLGVAVRRPKVAETTALGAAYLAGLAVGYWQDESEIARNWVLDREFVPGIERSLSDARYREWGQLVWQASGKRRTTIPFSAEAQPSAREFMPIMARHRTAIAQNDAARPDSTCAITG